MLGVGSIGFDRMNLMKEMVDHRLHNERTYYGQPRKVSYGSLAMTTQGLDQLLLR